MRFLKNLLGGMMVAEGVLAWVFPKKYIHLWRSEQTPEPVNNVLADLEKKPKQVRALADLEIIAGLMLLLNGTYKTRK